MRVLLFLFLLIFLVGCGTVPAQGEVPTPIGTFAPTETPTLEPSATPIPPSPEPFTRDTVYLESSELRAVPDQPGLVVLHVEGQLPTPCHQASSVVCPSCLENAPKVIQVNLYALIETGRECRGPTTPFEQDIPLGVYTEGVYVVQLNGQYVGEFDAASFGKEVTMERATVFLEGISMISPGDYNTQAKLIVQGFLPTPCNFFKADVLPPNSSGEIHIDAYSLFPTGQACIEVIQDFTSEIPLGSLEPGTYPVWVNGEEVGEVVVP